MRVGCADVEQLACGAPTLPDFKTEALTLPGIEILQVVFEIRSESSEAMLPPGLHPTLPPLLGWLVYRAQESPWGAFTLVQSRIECRSGVRPRGFQTAGFIDNEPAARALEARWGYRVREAQVEFDRAYHRTVTRVALGGETVLEVGLHDPDPLAPGDVQYVANMNLAHTPRGLRLVQVDPDAAITRAERGQPLLTEFDAGAWGDARLEPVHPVAASLCRADLTLPALRYLCRPDALAFQGTERAGT